MSYGQRQRFPQAELDSCWLHRWSSVVFVVTVQWGLATAHLGNGFQLAGEAYSLESPGDLASKILAGPNCFRFLRSAQVVKCYSTDHLLLRLK